MTRAGDEDINADDGIGDNDALFFVVFDVEASRRFTSTSLKIWVKKADMEGDASLARAVARSQPRGHQAA